jgi:thioredoxin 1
MLYINNENFKSEIEEAEGLILIDFFASWCGPCRMISPVLEALEKEVPSVKFCKVDVDKSPELARIFKVETIPFLALVRDNTFLDMSIGYKTKDEIWDFIESNK